MILWVIRTTFIWLYFFMIIPNLCEYSKKMSGYPLDESIKKSIVGLIAAFYFLVIACCYAGFVKVLGL